MKESAILQHLEEVAEKLNIRVCNVNLRRNCYSLKGGLCRVKGEYRAIIEKNINLSEKIDLLIDILQEFNTDSVYIHPYVRKLIERGEKHSKN